MSPRITLQPVSHVIRQNERNVSVFEISATGVGNIDYLWQKYDSFADSWISVSSRVVSETLPNLNFNIITEEDQGIYHCVVTNYDGSVMSDNATITVFGKSLLAMHISIIFPENQIKHFKCCFSIIPCSHIYG